MWWDFPTLLSLSWVAKRIILCSCQIWLHFMQNEWNMKEWIFFCIESFFQFIYIFLSVRKKSQLLIIFQGANKVILKLFREFQSKTRLVFTETRCPPPELTLKKMSRTPKFSQLLSMLQWYIPENLKKKKKFTSLGDTCIMQTKSDLNTYAKRISDQKTDDANHLWCGWGWGG